MIEIVSAVIVQNGRLLMTQRRPDQSDPWKWELPGGEVSDFENESHHSALRKSVKYELGVDVNSIPEQALWCGEVEGNKERLFVLMYATVLVPGARPQPVRSHGMGWFSVKELVGLSMTHEAAFSALVSHIKMIAMMAM